MLPPADPVRLALPAATPPPERTGIPIVATLAPIAMSLAIWALTQSLLSLLFAGLGPVVALAGLLDERRRRRRRRRTERARIVAALERLRVRVAESHDAERRRREALSPPDGPELARWAAERWVRPADPRAPLPVRVGRGPVASPVRLEGDDPPDAPDDLARTSAALRAQATEVADAVLVADAADGIGIVGPRPVALAAARALALQVAALVAPDGVVEAPADETWAAALPQRTRPSDSDRMRLRDADREALVAWAREEAGLPPGCGTLVRLDAGARVPGVTRVAATERARLLNAAAVQNGLGATAGALPERVELAELLDAAAVAGTGSLLAAIGRDARGPVAVDLVADGPHALVGGTTGSGKSELLVSWVLSMAHRRDPSEVGFLLVDFKGGAAFAPLAGVPHVIGILSDLDARLTRRAIESLRAELLRRERLLADAGARSIAELPPGALARLVVVVDEFAAVVAGQPGLHEVFGDLAARGRSLGLHLVLCTQRPSGVVRDGVLANVTLRIGLRMTDRADSIALLGDEGAARLPGDVRGRAVLGGDGTTRAFQVAIAGPGDLARARRASASPHERTGTRPWLDPLPARVPRSAIGTATADAIPFALADLPGEQRQPVAVHRPTTHGHLLVLGAAGAGRTTALTVLAAAPAPLVLPDEPADAWWLVDRMLRDPDGSPRLLVADDLDLLLGRAAPDDRHELAELLARLLREGPRRGVGVVASAQRAAGPMQPLVGLFGARLLLRMPSREEHVLAGGLGAEFDPELLPGAGRWRGTVVQVAWPDGEAMPAAARPELPEVPLGAGGLALIAARPGVLGERLRAAGLRVAVLGPDALDDAAPRPDVLLGDPDAWQAEWALLDRARRELRVALLGCTAAELRALARVRGPAPPLGSRPGECWLVEGGAVRRAVLPVHE